MNLESFAPKPHPTKAIFNKYNIKNVYVANYLERTSSYISGVLTGVTKCTPHLDRKLWEFARLVEKEMSEKSKGRKANTN